MLFEVFAFDSTPEELYSGGGGKKLCVVVLRASLLVPFIAQLTPGEGQ